MPKGASAPAAPASGVGERLRLLMSRRGKTLQSLAALSGLSARTIGAVAEGRAPPTVGLLIRIANALGAPVGSLISGSHRGGSFVFRKTQAAVVRSADGALSCRSLFPHDSRRPVEFYEVAIEPHGAARFEAHAPGTLQSLVVVNGAVEVAAGKEAPQRLAKGDAIVFEGDVPHHYRNLESTEALLYLVVSYLQIVEAIN